MQFLATLSTLFRSILLLTCFSVVGNANAAELKLLFMGDNGHHRPVDMFHQLAPVLEQRGIELKNQRGQA